MCRNPFTGDLAFSKQLTAQQHYGDLETKKREEQVA
jgi:hypothetical protein